MFPAAHSMDTTWFAVDRDGHVGVFESGEPGAVPDTSPREVDSPVEESLLELRAPRVTDARFDVSALLHAGLRGGAWPMPMRGILRGWPKGDMRVLLFRDDSVLDAPVRALAGLHVSAVAQGGQLVSFAPDDAADPVDERFRVWSDFLQRASKSAAFVAATQVDRSLLTLARRGLFAYQAHDARFNLPEPYGRMLVPDAPMRVDDLPASLRDVLAKRAHLPLSFAEAWYVQPAEHVPCATWESRVYLSSDGCTLRPLPGFEAEFADAVSELDDSEDPAFAPLLYDPQLPDD